MSKLKTKKKKTLTNLINDDELLPPPTRPGILPAFDTTWWQTHINPIEPAPIIPRRAVARLDYTQQELYDMASVKIKPNQWVRVNQSWMGWDSEQERSVLSLKQHQKYKFVSYFYDYDVYVQVLDDNKDIQTIPLVMISSVFDAVSRLPNFL